MTVEAALTRYLKEVTPTKRASTQAGEHKKAQVIIRHLGNAWYWPCWATCSPSPSKNGALASPSIPCPIRRPAPGSGRNRRLTQEEQTRLLQAVDKHSNPMFGWIVRIAVQTGMRLSEIATLRIRQVDIERRVVRLEHTKNSSPRNNPEPLQNERAFHLWVKGLFFGSTPICRVAGVHRTTRRSLIEQIRRRVLKILALSHGLSGKAALAPPN